MADLEVNHDDLSVIQRGSPKPAVARAILYVIGFAYRLAYRVGKRITNGRLYGTPLYRGVRGFLRRRLVADVI